MPKNLRGFLDEWSASHPHEVLRIDKPVSCNYEITAVQHKLAEAGKAPIVIFEQPVKLDGTISKYPVVTNLTANRDMCAAALNIHPKRVALEYSEKVGRKGDVVLVDRADAPVKEIIKRGDDVNLFEFPIPVHYDMDPGQYLSAAFVASYDLDTGVDNSAAARLWVREPRLMGLNLLPASHTNLNLLKFWKRGEDMPIAMWIGHHPAGIIGGQVRKGYPDSHWESMAGCLGEPFRVVATETHGEKLTVPADAEIVIEGYVPRNEFLPEGPFGDFTGYSWGQKPNPIVRVTCVTYRSNALFHDYGAGLPDQLVIGNFPLEARVYETLKKSIPEVQNVHVPLSGRRHHVYVSIKNTRPGVGRDIIGAVLAADSRIKHVFVVDDDVDIFSDAKMLWAIATRSRWDSDAVISPGGAWYNGSTMTKGGIDATLPPPIGEGLPNFWALTNRLPEDVDRKVQLEDYISEAEMAQLPGTF